MNMAVFMLLGWAMFLTGCQTRPQIDWAGRVGTYNFDQAVTEMGPPDKRATLTDGTNVCEWLVERGYVQGTVLHTRRSMFDSYNASSTPDDFLRLTFDKGGVLRDWKYVWR